MPKAAWAWGVVLWATVASAGAPLPAGDGPAPAVVVHVDAPAATVGDPIGMTVVVRPAPGETFEPQALGPELGPFRVVDGEWGRPGPTGERDAGPWTWTGTIAAYETGDLAVRGVGFEFVSADGTSRRETAEPVPVRIDSVLPADADPEGLDIADLQPPASVDPDWGPLRTALAGLIGLLLVAGAAWWMHRRWASRLSAAPTPPDPFRRMPPHEWAFRELQELLDRRLAEDGHVDAFHDRLSKIVKAYLGGRYRVDLLERTTGEIGPVLGDAGAPAGAVAQTARLLERCDAVKFAGVRPDPATCRNVVEDAYRLVDETRPRAVPADATEGAA